MMCEPVIGRHAQSLKLWLSMIDIYLQIPVIHQCHISVGCKTTISGSEKSVSWPLQSFLRILTELISTKRLLWTFLLLPYGRVRVQQSQQTYHLFMSCCLKQLWIQMDAKILLMIMKHIILFFPPQKS